MVARFLNAIGVENTCPVPDERRPTRPDPDELETEIRIERERAWVEPGEPPPVAFEPVEPVAPAEQVTPGYVHEDERVEVEPDGSVRRTVDRIEQPPQRRRAPNLVPAMLIILGLVLAVLAAAWYFTREDTKPVPSVTGLTLDAAVAELESDGFVADIDQQANDADEGTVVAQDPLSGAEADEGSTVRLSVSTGPSTQAVPNAVGLTETAARDRMAQAGFEVRVIEVFSEEPEGNVVAQNPPAGRDVSEGETIRLNVSKGTGRVAVPSLVGRSVDSAEAELEQLGLRANVFEVPSVEPEGTVVAQNPTSGDVRVGSAVRLNISTGAP